MKRTLIVLLAALVLLAAILLKKNSNENNMRKDSFVIDSTLKAGVNALRVNTKTDTTALQLKDGKWVVARDAFPVDTSKINKVLGDIFRLQNKELVSTSAGRLAEYGLDSSAAKHVTVTDASGKAMAQVIIGKTSGADYSSTYWKWESKPEVYRTPGNFTWEIATKDDDWKDRKLFAATSKDVKFVETTWRDSTGAVFNYKLEAATDSTWKMLAPQDSNRVKNALASEMATRFAEMTIDEFVAPNDTNVAKAKLDTPSVDVKVGLKNGTVMELKASKALGGYAYTQHPSRKDLIKLSAWRFDSFKKKPFELLDAPPAPKTDSAHAESIKPGATPAAPSAALKPASMPVKPKPVSPAKPTAPAAKP